jgi:CubicO group peptidase (beta-lactamase class C family)
MRVHVPAIALCLVLARPLAVSAAPPLDEVTRAQIDRRVEAILERSKTPSASIAVVKDGAIVYVHAYGLARLDPPVKATPAARYKIGSVTKELVAAAVLALQEQGKLSLDDKVAKWLPDLTAADQITLRQLLTHTSGYSDYWPQDYLMVGMMRPTTADAILADWAKRGLDFKPGEDWQYSNTGYVAAGRIIEKVTGRSLFEVLNDLVLKPVGIADAVYIDQVGLQAPDPAGYERHALGPPRAAPVEGAGWLSAAGGLALTAEDLAKWDLSLLNRSLLKPASYAEEFTPAKLLNGRDTGYALGLDVQKTNGRTVISHGGEVTGFVSVNIVFPDDKAALVVLTNTMSGRATGEIAAEVSDLILANAGFDAKARALFESLQQGRPDRSAFSDNFNAYLDAQTVSDYAKSLGPLGPPVTFKQRSSFDRGGMKGYTYRVVAGGEALDVSVYVLPSGAVEQFLISKAAT